MAQNSRGRLLCLMAIIAVGCNRNSSSDQPNKDKGGNSNEEVKLTGQARVDSLLKAAEEGQAGRVEELLKNGANVNDKDANGETAMIRAAAKGRLGIVKMLVDRKALMAEQDIQGQSALIVAARNNHRPIVLLLKDRFDEKDQSLTLYQFAKLRDKDGRTAMTCAAIEGHAEIVEDLLHFTLRDNANEPTHRDNSGKTALMYAAEKGHTEVVRVMLNGFPTKATAGYIALTDKNGKTPLQLAQDNQHLAIVELLSMK